MKKRFWVVVQQIIRKADIILEVLDARMDELTRIKSIEEYARNHNKPLILVINKADIVSKNTIENIKQKYHGKDYLLFSSKLKNNINDIIGLIKSKVKHEKAKVAVVGYPNTGKSSLINVLSKGGKVRVSLESGFTKGLQLIRGKGDLMLFDTPGIVPFQQRDEIRLGLVSGISPQKLSDADIVAFELIKIFKENNPKALEEAYSINPEIELEEFLIELAKKWNMFLKNAVPDERRAAIQLLTDWHNGKIRV
ncbi:50S ribosome-binding GTPase [Candidatus Woesearchaeota archaeon]|nr:50S ribosome-binding GTPase [Candidatus Woesearchaeota archaeon]